MLLSSNSEWTITIARIHNARCHFHVAANRPNVGSNRQPSATTDTRPTCETLG